MVVSKAHWLLYPTLLMLTLEAGRVFREVIHKNTRALVVSIRGALDTTNAYSGSWEFTLVPLLNQKIAHCK